MTEISIVGAIIAAAIVIVAHNEWRYRELQQTADVTGTLVGELCDMLKNWNLKK